nr:unnamed protein product [Callosobruchus chinensis]
MLRLLEANSIYNPTKRGHILKTLAKELTLPQKKRRLYIQNIPSNIKTKLRQLLNINEKSTSSVEEPPRKLGRGICYLCPRKADKKTPIICSKCQQWTCKNNKKIIMSVTWREIEYKY